MAFVGVRKFYRDNLSIGDRLGEEIYAVWMVVISIGIINSEGTITRAVVATVVITAFCVNVVWGIIDGTTVMLTKVIDRSRQDALVHALRAGEPAARDDGREHLEGTILSVLGEAEKERVLDAIAAGPAGVDPRLTRYRPDRAEWLYALGILLVDATLVLPLVLPLILIRDAERAVYVSRLIATVMFAALGAAYARQLHRRWWVAALYLGTLGYALFTAAFAAGW